MKIGVLGLGYVGLPLAVAFCEAGHDVAGVDLDTRVVRGAPLVVDFRGVTRGIEAPNLVRL